MTSALIPTYKRLPITFTKGDGVRLFDEHGQAYLDGISGIAVCSLGHNHPAVTQAICEQAHLLTHTSNLFGIAHQETLAQKLCDLAAMDAAFICNSGTEANEAAIKIAKKYAHDRGITQPKILTTHGSFHGRTLAAMSATGNTAIHAGFYPLMPGFIHVPYDDVVAVEQAFAEYDDIVAILVEPVQGEGGVVIPNAHYLNELRRITDEYQALLMVDEIQTGMARTGRWFAHQYNGIQPDVLTLAKALGNGFPIGAVLVGGKANGVLEPGNHGTTYGGNPLACHVANTVIDTMNAIQATQAAIDIGQRIVTRLKDHLAALPQVKHIRHLGCMIGIELTVAVPQFPALALEKHVTINVTQGKVIRLLPALTYTADDCRQLADCVIELVQSLTAD